MLNGILNPLKKISGQSLGHIVAMIAYVKISPGFADRMISALIAKGSLWFCENDQWRHLSRKNFFDELAGQAHANEAPQKDFSPGGLNAFLS
jgi:hypothetical protein